MPIWPYDNAWERFRKGKLSRSPLCAWCKAKGIIEGAVLVHHIKPVQSEPELRLDDDNTVCLCKQCHDTEGALSDARYWATDKKSRDRKAVCNEDGTPIGAHHWNDEGE